MIQNAALLPALTEAAGKHSGAHDQKSVSGAARLDTWTVDKGYVAV